MFLSLLFWFMFSCLFGSLRLCVPRSPGPSLVVSRLPFLFPSSPRVSFHVSHICLVHPRVFCPTPTFPSPFVSLAVCLSRVTMFCLPHLFPLFLSLCFIFRLTTCLSPFLCQAWAFVYFPFYFDSLAYVFIVFSFPSPVSLCLFAPAAFPMCFHFPRHRMCIYCLSFSLSDYLFILQCLRIPASLISMF